MHRKRTKRPRTYIIIQDQRASKVFINSETGLAMQCLPLHRGNHTCCRISVPLFSHGTLSQSGRDLLYVTAHCHMVKLNYFTKSTKVLFYNMKSLFDHITKSVMASSSHCLRGFFFCNEYS